MGTYQGYQHFLPIQFGVLRVLSSQVPNYFALIPGQQKWHVGRKQAPFQM